MNSQDFRNLQEAYMEVVMNEGDSAYDRAQTNRADAYGRAQTNRADAYGRAQTNRADAYGRAQKKKKEKTQREQADLYDIILSHLLDEGYAETQETAEHIMVNMSEDWKESIVEAASDQSDKQLTRGMKTTYKAQGIIDNQHQGKMGPNFKKLPKEEQSSKIERMERRLKSRRNDISGEQRRR